MPPDPKPSAVSPSPDIEFRAFEDDAWYCVRLLLSSRDRLKLMYKNLPDIHDRFFDAKDFCSLDAIQDFRSRFRSGSVQLQDWECGNVTQGTLVCASYSSRDGDVCFYDAIVEAVERKEHGREECSCSFVLRWKHGPDEGKMAMKQIDSICVTEPVARIDPGVASFLEVAMKQINRTKDKSTANSGGDFSMCSDANPGRSVSCSGKAVNSNVSGFAARGCKSADHSAIKTCSSLDRKIPRWSEESAQDSDLGGVGKHYMILVENLEKDIRASSITNFIQLQTSLSARACVFPCQPSESFARGAIFVDCEKDLKKLSDFLEDPNQIIVSTRGRPWMTTGKLCGHDIASLSGLMPKYLVKPVTGWLEHHNGVEVVRIGTEKYTKAKKLKEMFSHFVEKQRKLHERLAMEEGHILKQPAAK